MTSFFGIKGAFFAFFSNDKTGLRHFFQGLGENTCSLQPALKINAPSLLRQIVLLLFNSMLHHIRDHRFKIFIIFSVRFGCLELLQFETHIMFVY